MIEKNNSKAKILLLPAAVLATSLHYSFRFTVGVIVGYVLCKIYCNLFLENGIVDHVVLDYGKWKIHLHHWIMGLIILALVWTIDFFYLPALFAGVICGIILQGIYDYSNWHKVIIRNEDYQN